MNNTLRGKRSLRMLQPIGLRLSLSQLTIYSYRVYQSEFQRQAPTRQQVAKAVGLSRQTAMEADKHLNDIGLLDCNLLPMEPPPGTFKAIKPANLVQKEDKHWRHRYAYWTLWFRGRDCGLSPLTVAVWSWIATAAQNGFRRPFGASYIGEVLGIRRTSIQRVLDDLIACGLVVKADGRYLPRSSDFTWLADKWSGVKAAKPTCRWVDDGIAPTIPPARTIETATYKEPSPRELDLRMAALVRSSYPDADERERIANAVVGSRDWTENRHRLYLDLSNYLSAKRTCNDLLAWVAARQEVEI